MTAWCGDPPEVLEEMADVEMAQERRFDRNLHLFALGCAALGALLFFV